MPENQDTTWLYRMCKEHQQKLQEIIDTALIKITPIMPENIFPNKNRQKKKMGSNPAFHLKITRNKETYKVHQYLLQFLVIVKL